jgi:PhnB protein
MGGKAKSYIREGEPHVKPILVVRGVEKALEFYKKGLNATELHRLKAPNGTVVHGVIRIQDSVLMIAEEDVGHGFKSPELLGGSGAAFAVYFEDVDAAFQRAVDAGAKVVHEVTDQFHGERNGTIQDPFGHTWAIARLIEDLSPEEVQEKINAMAAQ